MSKAPSSSKIKYLQRQVNNFSIVLDTLIDHGDLVEDQLLYDNEILRLRLITQAQKIKHLQQQLSNSSIVQDTLTEHGDLVEDQLLNDNESLRLKIVTQSQEIKYLQRQLANLSILRDTLTEHGDLIESQLLADNEILEHTVAGRTQELATKNRQLQREIQERQRANEIIRKREEYYRILVRESLIGLALIGLDGRFVDVNQAFADIIGYSIAETLQLTYQDIISKNYARFARKQLQTTGRYGPTDNDLIHKNGSYVPVHLSGLVISCGGNNFVWFNVTNITEQEKLRYAKEFAEQARLAAETSNNAKSAFIANMSHELRTPLNAIIGYSELLQEDVKDAGHIDYIDDLQKIKLAGKHLLGIVSDILDLSKIESGKMDIFIEEVELDSFIDEFLNTAQILMNKESNLLIIERPDNLGVMQTDKIKLHQMLLNLISNAAKFTQQGLIFFVIKRNQEQVIFWVVDNGIGMTLTQQQKIFKPFTQADPSTTRSYGGTGLGLAITKQFAELLKGNIQVESKLGEGSTFTLSLPLQKTKKND